MTCECTTDERWFESACDREAFWPTLTLDRIVTFKKLEVDAGQHQEQDGNLTAPETIYDNHNGS